MIATLIPRQGPTFGVELNIVGELPDILIVDNRYYVLSDKETRLTLNPHYKEATMTMLRTKPPEMRGGKKIPVIAKGDPDDRE